jgi:hypothetical protein
LVVIFLSCRIVGQLLILLGRSESLGKAPQPGFA